jgi:BASS family bile acid:Na+ symporter
VDKPLADVYLNFSEDSLVFLNISLAFIMFGVALSINRKDFSEIGRNPKSIITGVISQFLLLPAVTFLFIYFARPLESLALGMILVASCPGGNVSNFFSQLSRGNIALSISLTAVATVAATIMTPLNFSFWSHLYVGDKLSQSVDMDTFKMFKMVLLLLVIPLFTGLWFSRKFPLLTTKISLPIRVISFFILIGFIVIALLKNIDLFTEYYKYIIYLVFIHNALALATGYIWSKILGNSEKDSRTISIETGIQNSGLGLVIIFTLFGGNGGMALITAWWGVWHIIAGITLSLIFTRGGIFKTETA